MFIRIVSLCITSQSIPKHSLSVMFLTHTRLLASLTQCHPYYDRTRTFDHPVYCRVWRRTLDKAYTRVILFDDSHGARHDNGSVGVQLAGPPFLKGVTKSLYASWAEDLSSPIRPRQWERRKSLLTRRFSSEFGEKSSTESSASRNADTDEASRPCLNVGTGWVTSNKTNVVVLHTSLLEDKLEH